MKTTIIKSASVLAILLAAQAANAYQDEKLEEICKKPKFTDFTLPEYHAETAVEIPPETTFEFKVSGWSNPETIRLTGHKEPIPFTVESNSSFHRIKAKMPADLTGKFVRIDAAVKAVLGCEEKKGWLVKVAEKAAAPQPETPPAVPAAPPATPAEPAATAPAPQ